MPEATSSLKYNYDSFIHENFAPHMRFDESPPLGETAPDFPLWTLEGEETSLREVCASYTFTVVEFGSFT
jgi:hypothetical protein